ncbi:hypothetical protein [Legionella shakespearei]|uniref:hypothetical protein n=1 Tax=Legionella shakespearei TaxID=45075 RepID=UPI000364DC42|nr:hypothetical protein [Legionella shakespearei]
MNPIHIDPGCKQAGLRTVLFLIDFASIHVVLSASFGAKDLLKAAWCQYWEILRAKRRAQDDVDRGMAKTTKFIGKFA